jgi:hypothetical protein
MGWRGTLRSLGAVARQMEREARSQRHRAELEYRRRQRMVERQAKLQLKLDVLERARLEVEEYEDRIEELICLHRNCSSEIDWAALQSAPPPEMPVRRTTNEVKATAALTSYKPSVWEKLMGKDKENTVRLVAEIHAAKTRDETAHQQAVERHADQYREWEARRELAGAILSGNLDAYGEAVQELNPFSIVANIGTEIVFRVHTKGFASVDLDVKGDKVIPAETKALTSSGKLTAKRIPQGKFYELYQDHVCSAVLRLAGELFAILPLDTVLVTACAQMVNPQTGMQESTAVLSVLIPKVTLHSLNQEGVDPSDAMRSFRHVMGFKRSQGFCRVEPMPPDEVTPIHLANNAPENTAHKLAAPQR